jgi:hypothetical protein
MARGTWGGTLDPHIFKCTIRFLLGTQQCQTGFHVRDVGIQDNSEQDVANEIQTQLQGPMLTLLGPNDSVTGFDARILGQDTGASVQGGGGPGQQQINTAETVPTFMSACVALKSEIRKRYGQGRMFLPCVSEGFIDGDIINTNGINNFNVFIQAMTDHFTGDPVTHDLLLVNAHGVLPPRPPSGSYPGRAEIPAMWYDVLSLRLNTIVTSLRSRKVGIGA